MMPFGQRQVSVIYAARNQYHVVMEVSPEFWQSPDMLKQIYVSSTGRRGQRYALDQRGCRHGAGDDEDHRRVGRRLGRGDGRLR